MQLSITPYRFSFEQEEQLSTARIDMLACIKLAQRRVSEGLRRVGAPDRLVRMAHGDLLETLLARAGACIAGSASYPGEDRQDMREAYMRLHLELTLATWLGTRAQTEADLSATRRCLRLLQTETAS